MVLVAVCPTEPPFIKMAIKAIFFDTADTLYRSSDFTKAQADRFISELSKRKRISHEEAQELFAATKRKLKSQVIHVSKVAVVMELGIDRLEMHESLAELDPGQFLQPDKKLNAILKRLGDQFELGVITNMIEKFLDKILSALEIDRAFFKYIVSVDNTKQSKPYLEPFLKAIELSGLMPDECVYVGDSLTKDMIPAKQAGMKTIWVSEEAKEDENVDAYLDSIYEIEGAIPRLLG